VTDPIRIGLDLRIAHARWLGGLFYLQNLILATRQLSPEEQPDLLGLIPLDQHDLRLESFADLVELQPFRTGDGRDSISAKIENRIRPLLALRSEIPWGASRAAMTYGVDVLFPTWKSRSTHLTAHVPWVPDLQHLHYPQNFSRRERAARDRAFRRIARVADLIVVSSETASSEFAARYRGTDNRLRILRFTTVLADDAFERDPAPTLAEYHLPSQYLLFPGQFWRHKNHRLAFEAVRILRDQGQDVCLVCTGETNDYRWPDHFGELLRYLEEHRLSSNIRILGVVPRSDYVQLLRGAVAVVQSSLFEGWSSIVEDARAVGARLLLSDIPVHREQRPPGAIFFPPQDAWALADAIVSMLGRPKVQRADDTRRGQLERVRSYGRTFCSIACEAAASRYK
jgi:glycosyltransferase involved in cell wall biosynthesis